MEKQLKEFTKRMERFDRHGKDRVFTDFLTLALCALHPVTIRGGKDDANEATYMATIKPYHKVELGTFAELLGLVQLAAAENPYSDLLGTFYEREISHGQMGQFFTPETICEFMAHMNLTEADEGKRILDPACGSGRCLLGAAKVNHRNYFYAADLAQVCAKMTALNFFCNGLKGEVSCMNSLSNEWFMGWRIHDPVFGVLPIMSETQSVIALKLPEVCHKPEAVQESYTPPTTQLTLF